MIEEIAAILAPETVEESAATKKRNRQQTMKLIDVMASQKSQVAIIDVDGAELSASEPSPREKSQSRDGQTEQDPPESNSSVWSYITGRGRQTGPEPEASGDSEARAEPEPEPEPHLEPEPQPFLGSATWNGKPDFLRMPKGESLFYSDIDGARQGPVDIATLLDATAGQIVPRDALVWWEGLDDWIPLHKTGVEPTASPTGLVPPQTPPLSRRKSWIATMIWGASSDDDDDGTKPEEDIVPNAPVCALCKRSFLGAVQSTEERRLDDGYACVFPARYLPHGQES